MSDQPTPDQAKKVLETARELHNMVGEYAQKNDLGMQIMSSAILLVGAHYAAMSDTSIAKIVEQFRRVVINARDMIDDQQRKDGGTA